MQYQFSKIRRCFRCDNFKAVDKFHRKGQDYVSYCKECRKIYSKEHYENNKSKYLADKCFRSRKLQLRVWDILEQNKCVDCGETDPLVLEFDHQHSKVAGVSEMMAALTPWNIISAEIAKCEIRCANCHRRQTAIRGKYWKYQIAQSISLGVPFIDAVPWPRQLS